MSTWYSQVEGKKFITWKLSQGGIAWAWSHLFSLIFVWAFIVWNSYTAPPPKFSKGSLQPVSLVTESEVQESERCLTVAPWSAGSLVGPQEPLPSTASSPAQQSEGWEGGCGFWVAGERGGVLQCWTHLIHFDWTVARLRQDLTSLNPLNYLRILGPVVQQSQRWSIFTSVGLNQSKSFSAKSNLP